MDIKTYIGRLKQLADALRDVRQPVRETSQVLNMLRGLSPKYRHAVPVITAKNPPHTFLSAHSYLLLEEQYNKGARQVHRTTCSFRHWWFSADRSGCR